MRYSDGDAEALGRAARCAERRAVSAPRSTRCARCRATSCRVVRGRGGRRCTCTCPSRSPRTTPAWRRTASPRPSCSPTTALLGPGTTAVHATHLTDDDIALLGATGTHVCFCPDHRARPRRRHRPAAGCTRRAAADARQRQPRGDRPVRGDARASRWTSGWPPSERGHWTAAELLGRTSRPRRSASRRGRIAVGPAPTWSRSTPRRPRTAGTGADEQTAVFAATAADVVHVVAGGRVVYTTGDAEEIGRELDDGDRRRCWP